ncbi:MAG: cyclic nucleotide-binding/CBS domain-containing protein [Deltaproteobacteria bacterium]|nr:cyclic nucleotide-binding/CBS domain-containing protein [Deltaproteobacteria bacterium]
MIPPKEFIKKIRPFSFLSEDELNILISGLEVKLFQKNKTIFKKGDHRKYVYIIFSGLVGLFDDEIAVDYISKGEMFGIISVRDFPYLLDATALEDTVCYLIYSENFKEVFNKNTRFSSFFSTFIKRRFHSFKKIASDKKFFEEATFVLDIEKIIYKKPVVAGPDITVENAAVEMVNNSVSSIVVVDNQMRPIGIFTDKDLRKVIIQGDKLDPISNYMTSPVKTINTKTTIFDAFSKMIDEGVDHLVVTKKAKVFGVITGKDIRIQLEPSSSIITLFRKIIKAESIKELQIVFNSIKLSVAKIVLSGSSFFDLSRMLCTVNDAIIAKVIETVDKTLLTDDFVWIHMGSLGRKEQVLATDQDNALIYIKKHSIKFVDNINKALAKVGIPECPGNYMASNEKWNKDLSSWKNYFKNWFNNPTANNARYLSIFLDMRPVFGNENIYKELIESLRSNVTNRAIQALAHDAIHIEPPIGIFGIRGLNKGVDLKTYGIYPIVNGIRVLAVDNNIFEVTNTKERLEMLNDTGVISNEMCHDLLESYGFLQDLRLKNQSIAVLNQSKENNLISVKQLRKIDLLILKETLKIVSSFQKLLMKKYDVQRVLSYLHTYR